MAGSIVRLLAFLAMAFALGGCGSLNTWLSTSMADHLPQWAGGPPPGVPPRPGTSAYDDFTRSIGAPVPAALQQEPALPPPEISKRAIF